MKRLSLIFPFMLFVHFAVAYGQTVLFSEGFESVEMPLNWKQEFKKGSVNWRYENGGYTTSPEIPNSRKPIAAHSGAFNALFQFQSMNGEATKLVTKRIAALEFAIKPELHFFNAQFDLRHGVAPNYVYSHDFLRVYYKTSSTSAWKLLKEYTDATTDWVERIIVLPENDLSADYYLAFEGETHWGMGTCVDDIQIIETGIQQKSLSEISVEQASTVSVASGTSNNPILKLKVKVNGNTGTLPVNSLIVNSLNTSDADIVPGGVKLYFTQDEYFNTNNQVGTGVSFASGNAVFSNLNYDLPTGYSYLWVTYDVKPTAGHRNTLDARFAAGSININGNTYLGSAQSPPGSRTIFQSIVSDDFESGLKWNLSGEFEYGSPQGLGGSQGNPDPNSAYSGTHIIGTDLTGLGDYPGDYEKNLSANEYTAVSDTFDFTYYNDLSIRYMRYLNIGINDNASVDISSDGGKTWAQAWSNTSMILDDSWKLHEIDITALAARKKNVMVRYSLGTTNDYWQLSGWNIDNFSITGNYVSKDVGIGRVVSPREGCGHTDQDTVSVIVKNLGAMDSYGVIPLQYSFNGNQTITRDTLKQIIPFGDSVLFTFKKKVNLSAADIYNFSVSTRMEGDDDLSNDGIQKSFYVQPTLDYDNTETFETKGGLWMSPSLKYPGWEWGIPGFGIEPVSGTKLWMRKLTSDYPNSDSSFVESVCYRNQLSDRKILKLNYWLQSEVARDGASVQYSTDNGNHWQLLDTVIAGWPWYTGNVAALHTRGWSGNTQGWVMERQILPKKITNAPVMKFRLAFASDADSNAIGIALDDFSIKTAPPDIGVSGIIGFADRCQNLNPDQVTVAIRNFGINALRKNDPVIVGFSLNQVHVDTDTFLLAGDLLPGQTINHTFGKKVSVSEPGDYNLSAYTLSESDPYFYGGNNDTLSLDFTVFPNPLTRLEDTISTRQPDTLIIRPFYDADYNYVWNDLSTAPTYHVQHAGLYTVSVTSKSHGCTSRDSSFVELLFNDAGIDSLIYPYNHCGLGKNDFVQVRIRNFGTDSIPAGQIITMAFRLNGGPLISDTLLLNHAFYAGHVQNFTFTKGPVDVSAKGNYHFKVYSSFSADTVHRNDTLAKAIEIYGHPTVSLGPDLTVQALSYTLDAGSGYSGYHWDDGTTAQTRDITESGHYWVRVTDENQCDNADTAYIWLKIRDIRPDGFASPVSACRFTAAEPISLKILNSGTDTVPSGGHVVVSYKLNESARITDSFDLAGPLFPGQSVTHNFSGSVDLLDTADYQFAASAVIAGDIRRTNDSLNVVIYRYPRPVVNFGLANTVTIQDIQFPLEAGYSPFYSYLWQDNFDQHLYTVTHSGTYRVKATDTRTSCYGGDTVTVFLIYSDIGVISDNLPVSGCTGEFNHVTVRIRNMGTSNIGKDVPFFVACDVDGQRVALDTLIRAGNFLTNSNIDLVLSAPIPLMESDSSEVSFYTLLETDKKPWNDTLTTTFYALPSPLIDFGDLNGVLQVDLPHILDAGAGNKSYEWQDGSSDQSYMVTQDGTYTVTVTGQNDCQSQKTVIINPATGFGQQLTNGSQVKVYPNPSHGLFNIKINDADHTGLVLQVINSQGQVVSIRRFDSFSSSSEPVDVQDLTRGMYLILIQGDGISYQGKMIIQ
jgi:hypothetical protein